ncbi:MAG: preprotein translocase subunit SecA [Acidimicrobiales bacterium]
MSLFAKVLRAGEGKKVKNLAAVVPLINGLEPEVHSLSDEELARKTVEFRERFEHGEELNDLLVEAFAVVREAALRTIGQRHFDEQLMGGMALHFGGIAEMKTGEGKTLVSTLPVYLNALNGRGVHVITVNDYLARRDSIWMGRIYNFLGLGVGLVVPDVATAADKRAAYGADLTYGTNTEMGFDYLRDNMAWSRDQMVQRGHVYAIVDEVDSILIDEARTPLLIAGPSNESTKLYYQFASIARALRRDLDYEVDEEKKTVVVTESGIAKVERQLGIDNLYDGVAADLVHQLEKALQAKELYHRDDDYMVADGEVKIIDEFTGRVLEGRRWSDGLHQAVEAKERVRIQEENHTWATVTLQNYFRMYDKLGGMTGTAETEAAEFASTYNLHVVPIPTHRPMVRLDEPDFIFKSEEGKFGAVVEDIAERYETGQPVLVGTASVERSEHLSQLLEKRGIPHSVLNAKQHAREATVVAQAGRLHAVTVATNMAGRGVDILLGGNPEGLARDELAASGLDPDSDEAKARYDELLVQFSAQCEAEADEVRALGGLYVLGSERHESRRIDNQLRGRSGRQGDPGESRFFLSLEDELMRLFATGAMSWVMGKALPDDMPIDSKMVTKSIEKAQNTVEAKNAEVRKELLKYDEAYDKQRKEIYARRLRIIDGEDLKEYTEDLLSDKIASIVAATCPSEFPEEWDLPGLIAEAARYYPTKFTPVELEEATSTQQLAESLLTEVYEHYEEREALLGGPERARELERNIMLQIIDLRWRAHLVELDYLREGIHLRGLAQTDPLVAWQRESYQMFGQLSDGIDDDYLQHVFHASWSEPEPDPEADLSQALYLATENPSDGTVSAVASGSGAQAQASAFPDDGARGTGAPGNGAAVATGAGAPGAMAGAVAGAPRGARTAGGARNGSTGPPVVAGVPAKPQKLGRNDPCFCGSGKKYKLCHGAG